MDFFNYKNEFSGDLTSPFFLQSQIIGLGNFRGGGVSQNDISEMFSRVTTAESYMDGILAVRCEDFQEDREVRGSVNVNGILSLVFACYSDNFSDVRFNHKEEAIKLAKAYLIQNAFMLREQLKIQTKVEVNTQALLSMAQQWEQEVMSEWGTGRPVVVK